MLVSWRSKRTFVTSQSLFRVVKVAAAAAALLGCLAGPAQNNGLGKHGIVVRRSVKEDSWGSPLERSRRGFYSLHVNTRVQTPGHVSHFYSFIRQKILL